jgi:uncharacterized membrane protein YjjP (DUF1212 family)
VAEPVGREARALALVLRAGQILLENGAEIFRVQETMTIMARSLGLTGYHDYVLTNGLFACADGAGLSSLRNVPHRGTHLGRVEAVNQVSRALAAGQLSLEEAEQQVEAAALPQQPGRIQLLASGVGSLCFAFLFGGGPVEALAAAAAGVVLGGFLLGCERYRLSAMLRRMAGAALTTIVCLLCCRLLPGADANAAIIGTLMILTPGVAMTMGIQDFIRGDYLSGTIRVIDALLIAGSIAGGTGLVLGVYGALSGVKV